MVASVPDAPSKVRPVTVPNALTDTFLLDDRVRGVPPGTDALPLDSVGAQHWHPAEGSMMLPLLTLDEAAFARNRDRMLRYAVQHGAKIAPHAKTPMAPALAAAMVEAGAWGTTVADIRQAAVMLRAGLGRLIIANEVGGPGGAGRLAALVRAWPGAEVFCFVDSVASVDALAAAWRSGDVAPLRLLVEVGTGRAGARDDATTAALIDAIATTPGLMLAGVAAYEGAAAQSTPERTLVAVDALLGRAAALLRAVRARVGPDPRLVATAGGSVFFDRVVAALGPAVSADGRADLVLRSGAIFFNDHGVYERAMASIDARGGFRLDATAMSAAGAFAPVLRLWAEVLSRPEPGLAICGMGMRDVSYDLDLPRPLRLYRDGVHAADGDGLRTTRLNDQHAFLAVAPTCDIRVGDVVEFGISHPCTCLHLYRFIFGVDAEGRVRHAYPTFFG